MNLSQENINSLKDMLYSKNRMHSEIIKDFNNNIEEMEKKQRN
jgi:hypothetical protein